MGIIYKKYLYSEAISLITVFTLSACAKPKLDAKLSVNDIVYMSRRAFKLEDFSEDMKNDLKTSAKQFYLKDEDGKTTTNVKKTVDAYFNAVLLGGESKDYSKFVSNDLDKAKGELNQYFSDSLKYSYDATDNIKPTGDEVPKVFGWVQTANRERGSYTVDNIIVAKDKTEFNVSMSTISIKAADDAYGANHPNLTDELKNYLQSNGANAGNVDQLTRQFYMETYLPNSIKEVSPSAPKTEGTNIFDNYSVELTKKDDKWAFSDKDNYVEKWDYYLLSYTYTGQQETITKNVKHKKISQTADFFTSHDLQRFARYLRTS